MNVGCSAWSYQIEFRVTAIVLDYFEGPNAAADEYQKSCYVDRLTAHWKDYSAGRTFSAAAVFVVLGPSVDSVDSRADPIVDNEVAEFV